MKYAADFETTTNAEDCRVWAWGLCEIGNSANFVYGNCIDSLMERCSKEENMTLYFHNLKFDGEFIIIWLFEHGFEYVADRKDLIAGKFTTLISDKGMFYTIKVCFSERNKRKNLLTIYDSLKILPFSVAEIAKAFNLPISKLEIDYKETRKIGHELAPLEVEYLKNDVVICALALDIMFNQDLTKMTQGSNALADYKKIMGKENFEKFFPPPDYDTEIRRSYKGGFTYLNPKFKSKDVGAGVVLDVNSLYPSVMYYNPLPYGEGVYFSGEYEQDVIYNLYIQNFTCQFELKKDKIPTIQLKNNLRFVPTEYLTSSNGEFVSLCLTSVDLALFKEHYNIYNIEYFDGYKFKSTVGLFKKYIDKWISVKIESTLNGNKAMRTLAKLMLNSLYGKFALNPEVQGKYPVYEDGAVKYKLLPPETRKPLYIPVGTFITSWARDKTIRTSQAIKDYSIKTYGKDMYIYSDTDSIHTLLSIEDCKKIMQISDTELGKWAHESTFTRARFIRQKSYIEVIDGNLHITCAGMPTRCYENVTWDNFFIGAVYSGKLQMSHVKGGIILKDVDFSILA